MIAGGFGKRFLGPGLECIGRTSLKYSNISKVTCGIFKPRQFQAARPLRSTSLSTWAHTPQGLAARTWRLGKFTKKPSKLLYLIPGLALVAFADDVGVKDSSDNLQTETQTLLEKSIEEQDTHDQNTRDAASIWTRIQWGLVDYLIEPIKTGLRFVQLSLLFVPLLVFYPMVLFGPKVASAYGEKSGAVIYYDLLSGAMEYAGPSFIKLGQWAASRTDIFSPYLCEKLSKLHSNNSPHSIKYTRKVIEQTVGVPLEDHFDEFPDEPIGVGAIAQVYLAKMKGQDNHVAVKVLHPRVRRIVERDLKIMAFFAKVINWIPTMEWLSLPGEVETFRVMMLLQIDLRIEAHNLETFRKNFADRKDITFPEPYHSSVELLVEEYVDGFPLDKFLNHSKCGASVNKEIADKGLDAFLKMLLLDNFIHSDLHPGNIFVKFYRQIPRGLKIGKHHYEDTTDEVLERMKDKNTDEEWKEELDKLGDEGHKPQVCFIDAGLVTELNAVNRRNFLDLFKAISIFDGYKVGELMIERSRTPDTAINGEIFELKVERLVQNIKQRTFALGSVKLGDLLAKVLTMVRQHHIRMEPDFITVVLSILLLEGIGRQLNPNLDLFSSAIPVLRQLQASDMIEFNEDTVSMAKIWIAIEVRQVINASIQDIHSLVKYDGLSPNQ